MEENTITIEKLQRLYDNFSKHSQYQILASNFKVFFKNDFDIKSTYEQERLAYIKKYVDFEGKRVMDIGGNTGFFSFEALNNGASYVDYYEGNSDHAEFVEKGAELIGYKNKISVHNGYFLFSREKETNISDIAFLLNVVHHFGDDYGNSSLPIEAAKERMISEINDMARFCSTLIFQMGFNWKGDRSLCLFKEGTKKEMLRFICEGVKDVWHVKNIGIVESDCDNKITYCECNEKNIVRNDNLGEFLNRPLFIMERIKK